MWLFLSDPKWLNLPDSEWLIQPDPNTGIHSEEFMLNYLEQNSIYGENVISIFSEREPCVETLTNTHNCAKHILEFAPNTEVLYAVDYGVTPEDGAYAREILGEILNTILK